MAFLHRPPMCSSTRRCLVVLPLLALVLVFIFVWWCFFCNEKFQIVNCVCIVWHTLLLSVQYGDNASLVSLPSTFTWTFLFTYSSLFTLIVYTCFSIRCWPTFGHSHFQLLFPHLTFISIIILADIKQSSNNHQAFERTDFQNVRLSNLTFSHWDLVMCDDNFKQLQTYFKTTSKLLQNYLKGTTKLVKN